MTESPRTLDHRLHSAFEWILERLPSRLGDRLRERTGGRFGIGTQIVLGLGGGVTLTVISIVLALILHHRRWDNAAQALRYFTLRRSEAFKALLARG